MSAKAYFKIIRPANCLIASAAVVIGGAIAVGSQVSESVRLLDMIIASCVVFLFVAAGNTLNDYYDHEVDRVNHPGRPIPSGLIERDNALTFAIVLFVPTFLLGFFINIECLIVVLLSAAIMIGYERRLKRRGFVGNLQISWLVASLFIFGGFSVYEGDIDALSRVGAIAILAYLATLGREITKDIEDSRGDEDRTTLPMTLGLFESALLARFFYAIAIFFSLIFFVVNVFGAVYLWSVLLADAVFAVAMWFVLANPTLSSSLSKVAMVVALGAFLLGGFAG